jgi:hypothetical protein
MAKVERIRAVRRVISLVEGTRPTRRARRPRRPRARPRRRSSSAEKRGPARRRAEREGSLFDLKRDTVKDIARAIAANMTFGRLTYLQKEIAAEIARLKSVQEQAG